MTDLSAGTKVGRFVIVRRLGAGGMGVVYEARDPQLSRRVAVKVLHDRRGAMRLLREAQALARLSHPNVVGVYELGTHDGQVFVAMELVDGVTLDRHLAGVQGWRAIVPLFIEAGRGLAAVHAQELVHRDVKPSNLLVDASGRVRVGDFGLARQDYGEPRAHPPDVVRGGASSQDTTVDVTAADTPGGAAGSRDNVASRDFPALLASPLTAEGAVVGTPRYMAPEQLAGGLASAAADQFAFCVALWECLYGEHPFGEGTELLAAIAHDRRRPPSSGRGVPRWLERTLARGLAHDPAARWPTMNALLDELERRPRARRRALAGAGAALGMAIVSVLFLTRPGSSAAEPCAGSDTRLVGVWDAPRSAHVREHLAAVDHAQGQARHAAIAALFDQYATDWQAMQHDACRANHVTHTESDTLYDRRMRCLDRRLAEFGDAVSAFERATDVALVDGAIVGAHGLTGLAGCADGDALLAVLPPPEDPARRRAVDAAEAEVDEVKKLNDAGKLEGLAARANAAVDHARATHHPPVLAHALRARVRVLDDLSTTEAAVGDIREAIEVAAQAHDDANVVWAWSALMKTLALDLRRPDQALILVPAARAALARAGGDPDLRFYFLFAEATVLYTNQHIDDALARIEEARALLRSAGAGPPSSLRTPHLADIEVLGADLYALDAHFDLAEAPARRAIALYEAAFGPDHPGVASAYYTLAESLHGQSKNEAALAAYRESARIRLERVGEQAAATEPLIGLGSELQTLDRPAEALEPFEHAIAILRRPGMPWQAELYTALALEAPTLDALGRREEERRVLDEAIAGFDKLDGIDVALPVALRTRGELSWRTGDCAHALPDFARAADLFTKISGADHPDLLGPLVGTGTCLVILHRPVEALKALDRASALRVPADRVETAAQGRLFRGRALYDSGRDRALGLRTARAACDELGAAKGSFARELTTECRAWLANTTR